MTYSHIPAIELAPSLSAIDEDATEAPYRIASQWLERFERALSRGDAEGLAELFVDDSHWRDLNTFAWDLRTTSGARRIGRLLARTPAAAVNFRVYPGRTPPRWVTRAGQETLECIIAFDAATGSGNGVLRLVRTNGRAPLAWTLLTALERLRHPERPWGLQPDARGFGGPNWLDLRRRTTAFDDRDPAALIVGAGQAGLSLAAHLGELCVDALVVEKRQRVGDVWRERYHSLTLHNSSRVCHLPFMPFPENTPRFIPKDKLAAWFESYAQALELNVWTGCQLAHVRRDEDRARWEVRVDGADGMRRTMWPEHLIFATGNNTLPNPIEAPGLEAFDGPVTHSSGYRSGHAYAGKRVIVIGTGSSGHDIAQDLHACGAHVTMVQRGPTLVVSLEQAQRVHELYEQGGPLADCDLIASGTPYAVFVAANRIYAAEAARVDRELIRGLMSRGFRVDDGAPDHAGYQLKLMRRGGGYYVNVGCSELIVSGEIGLLQFETIDRFAPGGVRLKDGRFIEADAVIGASGYRNQQDVVRACLGDSVADKVGPIWGYDEGGEQRNMWRPTAQPGLWFTGGGLPHVRMYSKYLAQQIKASLMGYPVEGDRSRRNRR